ncbi:hypothetical protein Leryth_023461 [Lithospermum erythrorhizon]|nr:hypothetical protein Leryth_023461 [Lithospermum erythrorhizon]
MENNVPVYFFIIVSLPLPSNPPFIVADLSNNHLKGVVSSSLGSISGMTAPTDNSQRQGSAISLTINFLDVDVDCECQDILVNWKKSVNLI